ncbi:type II secretion system protein GspC [Alteromonas sp. CYL-A6]|uniref:type II secretion system protein GspC n=1 Tax=Alteromonas nitratireducens TaxID=3390813 RepID=UPI0034B59F9C
MTFEKLNPQALSGVALKHQKSLRLAVVVVLSLYLIAFAANLTWRIIPEPAMAPPPAITDKPRSSATGSQGGVNISKIQQLNLFGDATRAPQPVVQEVVTDAPETRLNLTLTGVVVSSLQQAAAAIIENRGSQSVYGLGEKIEDTNATLQQVFSDRVIIRNGARNETLMLDGVDFEEANRRRQSVTRQERAAPEEEQRLSEEALEATASLRSQPANFTDFISISPKTEDGQLVGYQVKPGKEPALFDAAGLKAGDVIAQINGLDVTDVQQAQEALSELRSAQSIELTILRDGSYETLYLDLPEPAAQ